MYRVTIRLRSNGNLVKRMVFTKASSMHSCRGYWASKISRPTYESIYLVDVETAFVTSWAALDPNLEKVEAAIAAMPVLSDDDTTALISRLAANLAAKAA